MLKKRANIVTRKKFLLIEIFLLLLILLLMLSTATYTWFAISRTPTVNNMEIYVNSNGGLSLSWESDGGEGWSQHLDYGKRFTDNSILRPVTYSYENDCFYAARFGLDGRVERTDYKLNDDQHTNRDSINGYYVKATFYGMAEGNIKVSLSSSDRGEGTYVVGTPMWDDDEIIHVNGGGGAQYAVRIGFRITPLDKNGEPDDERSRFVIYEPNATHHVNYEGEYVSEYIPTSSIDGENKGLAPETDLIRQSSTLWTEADPVRKDVVVYKHGEFLDDTALFELDDGETVKIDMYMWLEGQDVDCTNQIGDMARIFSSIQFLVEFQDQSGMEEIK